MTEEKKEAKPTKGVSRREFIAGTVGGLAVGAVVGAATGSLAFPTIPASVSQPWLPSKWDYTSDVIVVGTGLAGLAAAVAAHDAGADVLVLEKLDKAHEGGNSITAGQWICAPVDMTKSPPAPMIAEGAAYFQAMANGTIDDPAIFTAKAQGYYDNLAWVKSLGGNLGTCTYPSASHPGPGSQYLQAFIIAPEGAPLQSNGFPLGTWGDKRLWNVFRNAVTTRNIQVLDETPATDLIQNGSTKEILGVYATQNGTTIAIKANKAVILACGSIEFAPDLQKQYLPFWPIYSMSGSPGNTGDGVRMAQKAGAALWHMNAAYHGGFSAFVIPGTDPASATKGGVNGVVDVATPGILVNKLGNRFNMGNQVNGPLGGFGGETNVGEIFDINTLDFDSIPCWAIFDDTMRTTAQVNLLGQPCMNMWPQTPSNTPGAIGAFGWFNLFSGYTWSADNSAEVAKGWILSANSLSDLAAKIAADPDDQGEMTGAQLQATVSAYNLDCTNKADAQFFTPSTSLTPINGPPFYAIKLWPVFDHGGFGGGPRRNVQSQIVDPSQKPIPRLYSAGELGGFYYFLCAGGEHLSDCLQSGRVAGQNAAKETSWS